MLHHFCSVGLPQYALAHQPRIPPCREQGNVRTLTTFVMIVNLLHCPTGHYHYKKFSSGCQDGRPKKYSQSEGQLTMTEKKVKTWIGKAGFSTGSSV
nr:MAG TPA_asm: hypothetical protein [Caudoviricetes sp.]